MGLKKIEIKKIGHKNALNATFKKRRQCLFHKADELSSKTGAQIAIIVFSPADNPFTFGHPSADLVIDLYYHPGKQSTLNDTQTLDENHGLGSVNDEEKVESWLDKPIEGMGLDELKQYARWVADELEETKMRKSCTKNFLANWV